VETQQAGTTLTANVSAMSGTATISYQTYIVKKTGSSPDIRHRWHKGGKWYWHWKTKRSHTITDSEASGTPDQFRAFTTGTNSIGSNTVASNTVISTPFVPTQYTISWNANGGSVSSNFKYGKRAELQFQHLLQLEADIHFYIGEIVQTYLAMCIKLILEDHGLLLAI
jgi:hypothetical protein